MEEKEKRDFWNCLCEIVGSDHACMDEPMKNHTTFRIGGNADYFVSPHSAGEIRAVTEACRQREIPFYIIGNGSNLLVGDKGYRGVIIRIFKNLGMLEVRGERIWVQAGVLLSKTAKKALEYGLTGFEFASGIPGTIGGALMMNAGAYGGEMKDVVETAKVLTRDGNVLTLSGEELEFGYRTSAIAKNEYIALEAVLRLGHGEKEKIRARMEELKQRRISKQPLDYPSAGSTFKRPEGYFAGKLIMDAGLRGFRTGDAQISEKHCGFVVNCGEATAADVRELMREVSERVKEQTGVVLEPEVKMLGEF